MIREAGILQPFGRRKGKEKKRKKTRRGKNSNILNCSTSSQRMFLTHLQPRACKCCRAHSLAHVLHDVGRWTECTSCYWQSGRGMALRNATRHAGTRVGVVYVQDTYTPYMCSVPPHSAPAPQHSVATSANCKQLFQVTGASTPRVHRTTCTRLETLHVASLSGCCERIAVQHMSPRIPSTYGNGYISAASRHWLANRLQL